ncbi:MmgE/PrpD family protein, partial [Bordetella pertussis]|uniref:MmgE/PrpD family protein n=1 Tax=Bordetella pertussis TaxID=520 RepID=UPI000A747602
MPAAHATSQPPATRWLAEHALGFDYDMLPADARRIVRHCILDWYAVTLAACREPAVAALVDDALEEGAGGASPVIGHAAGVSQGAPVHRADRFRAVPGRHAGRRPESPVRH